jgi:cell division protein ZipA
LVAELRWILLGLSVLLLAGIWWWGARRSRQAPGNAELRESTASAPAMPAHTLGSIDVPPGVLEAEPAFSRADDAAAREREWGVPPFEPLSIRTADFEQVQVMDMPMSADPGPHDVPLNLEDVEQGATLAAPMAELEASLEPPQEREAALEPPPQVAPVAAPRSEPSDRSTTGTHQAPNVSETQRIVSIRVSAHDEARWPGGLLMAALENHGLGFGRYKVFHRKHSDGRTLFCAASMVEPGTFDIARMPQEEFRGLTLFAVLPGPGEPIQTVDALIATASELALTLHGSVQDSKGEPLSAQLAEALREDVARFQASLTMT